MNAKNNNANDRYFHELNIKCQDVFNQNVSTARKKTNNHKTEQKKKNTRSV